MKTLAFGKLKGRKADPVILAAMYEYYRGSVHPGLLLH